MTDVCGGAASDVMSIGQTFVRVAGQIGGKIAGRPASVFNSTFADGVSETFGRKILRGAGKVGGALFTLCFLGLDIYEGVKSYKEWQDDPYKSDADLAYAVFLGMGGRTRWCYHRSSWFF